MAQVAVLNPPAKVNSTEKKLDPPALENNVKVSSQQDLELVKQGVKQYLGRIFSLEDHQTIFNGKKINISALADLIASINVNPDLTRDLLQGINQMNFANHQVEASTLDTAIKNLLGSNKQKITNLMEELVSLYSQGIKLDFPNKLSKAVEAILILASDANFNQNIFQQINNMKPKAITDGEWLQTIDDDKEPDDILAEDIDSIDPNTAWGKVRAYFHDSPPWFQHFRDNFTMVLNYIGIVFNTTAVVAKNSNVFSKDTAEMIDRKSEWYSRYVIPFSFAWNGVEALVGNRLVEALTRIVPAISFWALPFYNFNTATGVSSGVNYMLELVTKRLEKKKVKVPSHNMLENTKVIGGELLQLSKDFLVNAKSDENWIHKITSFFLLGGSLGGFFFAAKDRDTWLARLFGNVRNIGGFFGDYDLVTNRKYDVHKKVVGLSCGVASILNMIMRWVNPELARTLNHISIAADDFGLTYWAQDSRRHNKTKNNNLSTQNPRSTLKQLSTAAA